MLAIIVANVLFFRATVTLAGPSITTHKPPLATALQLLNDEFQLFVFDTLRMRQYGEWRIATHGHGFEMTIGH